MTTQQNIQNHTRYYKPHHFVFYPLMLTFIIAGVYFAITEHSLLWLAFVVTIVMITWLSFMLRQHYALTLQNRIVRLEMRLRYYQLTHQKFEDIEAQLSFGQIAALRFAADAELAALVQKAVHEKLSPVQIKKSIVQWYPDDMRI